MSLRLDHEISEIENALLDAHLARCPECAEVDASLAAVTEAIRTGADAQPPALVFTAPPRRGSTRAFLVAAASVLALTVGVTGAGWVGAAHFVSKTVPQPELRHVSAVAGGAADDLQLLAKVRLQRAEPPVRSKLLLPT